MNKDFYQLIIIYSHNFCIFKTQLGMYHTILHDACMQTIVHACIMHALCQFFCMHAFAFMQIEPFSCMHEHACKCAKLPACCMHAVHACSRHDACMQCMHEACMQHACSACMHSLEGRAFTILASLLEKLQHTSVFVPETFIDKNVSHEYHSWLLYNTRQNRTILKNLDPTH